MKNRLSGNILFWLVLCIGLAFPMLALADNVAPTSPPFQIKPDDYFIKVILKGFLGEGVIDPAGATAQTTITSAGNLGEIFRTFNLGVAFFGTLMVTFVTVVGVLQSGNDGEFLGKRWSSMWVPFRFAAGSALMLPLTNSGYSFIQAIVIWIAMQGVGFADTLWESIVKVVVDRSVAQVWGTIDGVEVASQVMLSSVCTAVVNKHKPVDSDMAPVFHTSGVAKEAFIADNRDTKTKSYVYTWGNQPNHNGSLLAILEYGRTVKHAKLCGEMVLSYSQNQSDVYAPVRETVAQAHNVKVTEMANAFKAPAMAFVDAFDDTSPNSAAVLETARNNLIAALMGGANEYRNHVTAVASSALNTAKAAAGAGPDKVAYMTKYGFVSAGMFYIDMTRVHGAVRESTSSKPSYSPPKIDQSGVANFEVYIKDFTSRANMAKALEASRPMPTEAGHVTVEKSSQYSMEFTSTDPDEDSRGIFAKLTNSMATGIIRIMFGVGASNTGLQTTNNGSEEWFLPKGLPGNNTSSIMELKNKGDIILDVAGLAYTGMMVAGTTSATASEVAGGVPFASIAAIIPIGIKHMINYAMPMMLGAILALISFGFALSIYVPMVPYILWMGGIIGYLVLIAEALVASSLWAVMLMHPSGEGMTSQQSSRGVMLLLSLFTRPALMLMGLVVGMFMVEPLVTLINDTFYYTLQSVQASTISLFFSVFGFCAIYVSLILTVVNKCFSMIHIMPDKVLRWIDGGAEQLGEGSVRDHAKGTVTAVAGGMGAMGRNLGGRKPPKKTEEKPQETKE